MFGPRVGEGDESVRFISGSQGAGMRNADPSVHQIREYRTDASLMRQLPFGLLLCLLGLFAFALDDEPPVPIIGAASLILAAGLAVTVIALVKPLRPGRTMFVLSPA